ncbi:MAG: DNA primase catalytic subunit PriS, partial [Candidatus Methanoperedens sp.]|nr:DNA primase catalytic subunit PriS [Candidatus Methanoperedens sp.]
EMSTWAKRAAERIVQKLEKIRLLEHEEALKELKKIEGVTTKKAEDIIKSLQHFDSYDHLRKTIFEAGLDQSRSMWSVRQSIVSNLGVKGLEGETDEPVTADIKRLIRMPSSLHGGSGMKVVPLTLDDFEKFQPLSDAIVFSEKEIQVEVIPPLKPQNSLVEMKGQSFRIKEGMNTLPEYAAIYLMCRGAAEYA